MSTTTTTTNTACCQSAPQAKTDLTTVRYGTEKVGDIDIFYREAGDPSKPAVVLLHGFPASSYMYRELLANLGDQFYLIAPDYPGFGNSSFPDPKDFEYTFDNIARIVDQFLIQRGVSQFVLGIQDYGAPIGFRIAVKHPEKVTGFVVMNGNAYEEGFHPENTALVKQLWTNRSPEVEDQVAAQLLSLEGIKFQYTFGASDASKISPDNWNLDFAKMDRPGQRQVQLDLLHDYQNNLKQYPAWQAYLRSQQPPMLIAWGNNDPIFPGVGAESYKRDVNEIDFHLLDTGHFPLEEEAPFIIEKMREFLNRIAN